MVTFDADDTIYEDGGSVSRDSPVVDIIVRLLRAGVIVSLVTAAGYPGNVGCTTPLQPRPNLPLKPTPSMPTPPPATHTAWAL